ncbi:acyl carrier protein [Herbaspirillum sp. SJZ130]|nr:acyl carrier protein [Herbaspirillum sp. SJZ130]TQK14387.1 acyl carrier protein [Herbaspirillum sp. SJZ106]TWC66597.1 acyl carrier protein [Herbaspirillum sp. SJZ099]
MTRDELRTQVRSFLGEYFMTAGLPDEQALLVDDLGADSLDLLQVAYMLNDMFDIEIDAEALPQLLTVSGACDVVERLRGKTIMVTRE